MPNPVTDHDIIVQYNRENGTNFYNIKQVNEDKLKKAEAHKVWANNDETVGSSRFRATNAAAHNAPTQKQATKITLDAAKQRGVETAAMAAVAAAPYALPVIANPTTASTTAGAVAATGLDASGLAMGLNQLNNYWNNRKNLTWKDTPGILLSGLSLVPGSSQLTNPRNLNIAVNTVKSLNPAFKYRSLLERVKVNPELAPYYNDAASAKIKVTLKNDGTYNPDTHTVTLPLFGNKRTIAHEMGHAALRGGEIDVPNYDYTGTGLNRGNEAAADWFAGNLNERYYGKNAVMQARQNAVDNFDIIRHSLADGTLRFGEPATYNGVHQSSKSIQQFEFPYQRWDVINHDADPNGAFFTLDKPAEAGFLAKRPYTSYWEIKSQKPLIQTGEIRGPGNTKNNVRNAIVDYARRNGADAVEFRGIADNNLKNQNVLFATDKSGIRFKYESPVTEEISLVPQEEFASLEPRFTQVSAPGSIINLNKLGKVNLILKPDKYWYVVHQTSSRNLPGIMKEGLKTGSGLNGTALNLSEDFLKAFQEGNLRAKGLLHKGSDAIVIGKFPKSKFPSGRLDDISERLMELGESSNFEVPTQYLRGLIKTQYKQGGILKSQLGDTLPEIPQPSYMPQMPNNVDWVWKPNPNIKFTYDPNVLINAGLMPVKKFFGKTVLDVRSDGRRRDRVINRIGAYSNLTRGKKTIVVNNGGEIKQS